MKKFATLDAAIQAYEELNAKFEALTADHDAAQALAEEAETAKVEAEAKLATSAQALAEAKEKLQSETARADGLQAHVDTLQADVDNLKDEAKSAETRAAEICAAAGIDPIETEAGNTGDGTLMEQYNAIKDPVEKGEFLKKHQAALYKESVKSK